MVSPLRCILAYSILIRFAEDVIYDHKFQDGDVLGLDHIDRSGKTRTGVGEKAIVIKG
jgi:hypothetical protein